ncbi:hypothetical protein HIM_07895 [Hirsutella minnesotensis 3608]|uniref:diphosphoinositol-polyphosphate diphosphatase n=1 Tax=Hirsutella minnesotensis 3608 TaxID=1043627 RepID=A0A0F7ZT91_9HYPO|nr:hypothetical protein HIM_07895 [Hirsutella minnesotensis 3608]
MASKRNSRVFIDETKHCEISYTKATSHRQRRDSHGSLKDDMSALAHEVEDGLRVGIAQREVSVASRTRSTSGGRADTTNSGVRIVEKTASVNVTLMTRSAELPSAPLNGRPVNFGVVIPGVYRSSYPKPEDYVFLKALKLKTIVTLVKKDDVDDDFETFTNSNGIRQFIFNMKGTKKEAIPLSTMNSILETVLDQQNHPLLLHCNHGKHRTGCVVAIVRKLAGWNIERILDEYKTYAAPKIRECDVDYISSFQSSSLQTLVQEIPRGSPVQTRTFFRTLMFSTFVMVLWLVSGSKMAATSRSIAN